MDHFTMTDHGQLYSLMRKMPSDLMYASGCIFVNHAAGNVHV